MSAFRNTIVEYEPPIRFFAMLLAGWALPPHPSEASACARVWGQSHHTRQPRDVRRAVLGRGHAEEADLPERCAGACLAFAGASGLRKVTLTAVSLEHVHRNHCEWHDCSSAPHRFRVWSRKTACVEEHSPTLLGEIHSPSTPISSRQLLPSSHMCTCCVVGPRWFREARVRSLGGPVRAMAT